MSSALYKGLGYGLMSFGQNLQQQMANSAAQRRQDSLLALKRDWQIKDREWEAKQRTERDEELLHRNALAQGFSSVEEMQQHMGEVRGHETRTMQREDEWGPELHRASLNRLEKASALADAQAKRLGQDPAEDPVLRRQILVREMDFVRNAPAAINEHVQPLMNEVQWDSKKWRNQLNRIPPQYLQGVTEGMGPSEVQRRIRDNVSRGFYESYAPTLMSEEAREAFRSSLGISDDGGGGPPRAPAGDDLGQQGRGERGPVLPTLEGGEAAHQVGASLIAGPSSVYRGMAGGDLPESASLYEQFGHGTGTGLRALGDVAGMAMLGRQPGPDSPVSGLMNIGRDVGRGAYAHATGQPVPGGQPPSEVPAGDPQQVQQAAVQRTQELLVSGMAEDEVRRALIEAGEKNPDAIIEAAKAGL